MLKHKTGICSQNMKVFRYFGPLLLLCLTREILHVACKTKTQKRYDHVKRLRKDSVSYSQRTKDVSENHFKRKKIPHGNNQEGPFSDGPQKGQRIFKTNFTIHSKPDLHIIGKAGYKSTKSSAKDRANSARSDTTQNHLANKISNLKPDKISYNYNVLQRARKMTDNTHTHWPWWHTLTHQMIHNDHIWSLWVIRCFSNYIPISCFF